MMAVEAVNHRDWGLLFAQASTPAARAVPMHIVIGSCPRTHAVADCITAVGDDRAAGPVHRQPDKQRHGGNTQGVSSGFA